MVGQLSAGASFDEAFQAGMKAGVVSAVAAAQALAGIFPAPWRVFFGYRQNDRKDRRYRQMRRFECKGYAGECRK